MNDHLKAWEDSIRQHRPYLLSFAFRMTGSLSEAEDIVQESFLECAQVDPQTIGNHRAWLTKVCSNKALDALKKAYKKRESYPGTWLPDAIPDSFQIWGSLTDAADADRNLLLAESLTTSFLLIVERLSPEERVVYLLAEVFEYPFATIAQYLSKTEAACRKMAERARKAVVEARPRFDANNRQSSELIERFFQLAKAGDNAGLQSMLAEKSEFWSDGGGRVPAARNIVPAPAHIAAFFTSPVMERLYNDALCRFDYVAVNGRPGMIISRQLENGEWAMETVTTFEIQDGRIARIYSQRNPDKLQVLTSGARF